MSVRPSIHPSIHPSTHPSTHPSFLPSARTWQGPNQLTDLDETRRRRPTLNFVNRFDFGLASINFWATLVMELNWGSSANIVSRLWTDDRGSIFLQVRASTSRPVLGPTQPPLQWVPVVLSPGIKRSGRVADHSPQSSVDVNNGVELHLHSLNTSSWGGA
jgi:hypothetical protein